MRQLHTKARHQARHQSIGGQHANTSTTSGLHSHLPSSTRGNGRQSARLGSDSQYNTSLGTSTLEATLRTLRCSRRLREHQPLVISGAARLIMVLQQGKFSLGHRRHPFQRSPTRLAPALWHAQPKRETRSMTATQEGGHSAPRASLGRICRTWL